MKHNEVIIDKCMNRIWSTQKALAATKLENDCEIEEEHTPIIELIEEIVVSSLEEPSLEEE